MLEHPANSAGAGESFLIVRMGSMGDVVHTLPAAAALRDSFPAARIDWLIDSQWRLLLEGNPDLDGIVSIERASMSEVISCVRRLRAAQYTCALDFQSLYKSSLLALLSGARRRVGFDWTYSRESAASFLYTERVSPRGAHKVEHNLSLAEAVGAKPKSVRFPLIVPADAAEWLERELSTRGIREFFVLCPGGGWRSKCWPAARYGEFHREIANRYNLRGVISFGPGEEGLAEEVRIAAGAPAPAAFVMHVQQMMALLRRAKFVLAGDTGPLHVAAALGTPVVGLYGPTDPARNGPYSDHAVVVRKARPEETTYKRSSAYSPAMLSITVTEAVAAIEQLMRAC